MSKNFSRTKNSSSLSIIHYLLLFSSAYNVNISTMTSNYIHQSFSVWVLLGTEHSYLPLCQFILANLSFSRISPEFSILISHQHNTFMVAPSLIGTTWCTHIYVFYYSWHRVQSTSAHQKSNMGFECVNDSVLSVVCIENQ